MKEQGIPVRVICRGFSLSRTTLYRYLSSPVSQDPLSKRITELAYKHPQYGYRRIRALLKKEVSVVNQKKVYRLYTRLSLQKEVKRSRKIRTRVSTRLTQPEFPGHVWSADFVFRTDNGPEFREIALNRFLSNGRIKHEFIDPGKPQQNGFSESFNARLNEECLQTLDLNLFPLKDIQNAILSWAFMFNHRMIQKESSTSFQLYNEVPIRNHIVSY